MNLGGRGLLLIQSFEKLRLVSYQDTGGVWTIGWGHTGKDVKANQFCTRDQADTWLAQDTLRAVMGVNAVTDVPLTQNQFDALVSFTYNVGVSAEAHSTLQNLVNQKRFAEAAEQFERWVFDNGVELEGLKRRRAAERALFEAV